MPQSPPRLCSVPGCGGKVREGRCDRCSRKRGKDTRLSSWRRGYTNEWRNKQKTGEADLFLEENPHCVECKKEGRIITATIVDHIIPHRLNMRLFWDKTNWQPLCEHHHNVKTGKGL